MSQPTRTPLADGATRHARANGVLIILQCVRANASYRVVICHGSTGQQVDELAKSFPTEAQARRAANMAYTLCAGGWTIQQLLDAVTLFATA